MPRTLRTRLASTFLALIMVLSLFLVSALAEQPTVAQIGDDTYTSLADALDEATDGQTIEVITPATVAATETYTLSGKAITLDLNGHSVTWNTPAQNAITVKEDGGLTIQDTSSNETGKLAFTSTYNNTGDSTGIYVNPNGALTLQSGTISYTAAKAGRAIYVGGTGTFAMSEGTVEISGSAKYGVYLSNNNSTNITGGEILLRDTLTGTTLYGLYVYMLADAQGLTIENLTVDASAVQADQCAYCISGGWGTGSTAPVTISGGTYTTNENTLSKAIYSSTVKNLTISGGTFNGVVDSATSITDGTFQKAVEVTDTITGGTFEGNVTAPSGKISGGKFNVVNPPYDWNLAAGKTFKQQDDNYYYVVDDATVAEVSGVQYTTLEAALEAAQDGQTVTLLTNTEYGHFTLDEAKIITIDLADFILTKTDGDVNKVQNGAKLTIKNGTLVANSMSNLSDSVLDVSAGSTVTLDDIVYTTNGTALGADGLNATLIVKGSTISAEGYCIATNAATEVNHGVVITLESSTLNATVNGTGSAICYNVPGLLTMDQCTVNGYFHGVIVRGGTAVIKNSTITNTMTDNSFSDYFDTANWGSGNMVNIAALTLGNKFDGAYQYPTNVTLINTTVTSAGSAADAYPAIYAWANNTAENGVTIAYDNCTITGSVEYGNECSNITVCAAKIDGTYYATLATAIDAAVDGDTVTLLSKYEGEAVTIFKAITVDLAETGTSSHRFVPATAYQMTTDSTKLVFALKTFTVTFNSNGGSQVAAQAVTYNATVTEPATPTRSGYAFDGWYSDEGLTTGYDFSTPVTGNITLYAKWSYVGASSSGGSSSSGSSSGTTTETETNPDGSTTTTVTKPDGTVTETTKQPDGSTTQVVTKPDGSSTTTVDNKDGSSSTTTVSKDGQVEAEVKLPAHMVNEAADKGETVALPMPQVPVTSDKENAPAVTVDLPANTTAKVEIPVADVTAGTVAVLVKDDGTEEIVKTSVTTENGVTVTLSDGDTVKIVDNSKDFGDVSDNHWGSEAVAFASSRELFAGTSATTFSPDMVMNRSMIVTVLARFEGVDTSTGDTWYEVGRQWATENGISDGSNMDQGLSREQLATMLWRYAGSPSATVDMSGYTDAGTISAYARQAMAWCVDQGIIDGTSGSTLSPQGSATRAQVATVLMRFIEGMA